MGLFSNLAQLILFAVLFINAALALLIYRDNTRSATNIIFALLSAVTSAWLFFINKANISSFPDVVLLYTRLTVFFAASQSALFFLLAHTIPSEKLLLKKSTFYLILVATLLVMGLTLTPYVFKGVEIVGFDIKSLPGPAIPVFGIFTTIFSLGAIYVLSRKIKNSAGEVKSQLKLVMTGILVMLGLIIATIMIPVIFFQNQTFLPFAPLYALIFLGLTAYSIVKYRLFNLKLLATEAFVAILWIALFSRILSSSDLAERSVDFLVFATSLIVGVLLIRSVRREVRQKEELQRLTEEMQATNDKLTELSKFKSQLLSLASHQIKSPLAVIKGFADIILQGLYGSVNEQVKEAILKIRHSTDELIKLINTLLDLRRVDEGKMEFQMGRINLFMVVGELIEQLRPLALEKSLNLQFSGDEFMIKADYDKIRQVAQNLIDNSIKYTPTGYVKVSVRAAQDGKTAMFCVEDSGLGISPVLLPHLFEEFTRDDRVKKAIRGTGLGLYIARRIVEAHGGKIWAESAGEGKGSKFCVQFPRYEEDQIPAPVAASKTLATAENEI